MFRRRVAKRAGGGRGHIEEGRRRLDALGEQSRRREELQQKRRRMRFLPRSSAPCAIGAAHGLRASGSAASWASGARRRRARRRVVVSGPGYPSKARPTVERRIDGFEGVYFLVDRQSGKALSTTCGRAKRACAPARRKQTSCVARLPKPVAKQ